MEQCKNGVSHGFLWLCLILFPFTLYSNDAVSVMGKNKGDKKYLLADVDSVVVAGENLIVYKNYSQDTVSVAEVDSISFYPFKDCSDRKKITIPKISVAVVKITADHYPISKDDKLMSVLEYSDANGIYFKKNAVIKLQGNSSVTWKFPKQSLAISLLNDDSTDCKVKYSDWVRQSEFHLKSNYIDRFRGVTLVSYNLNEEMWNTRGQDFDRPYKMFLPDSCYSGNERCMPDGFPVKFYFNGEFYGMMTWNLKKHRDNFSMDKKDPNHIILDGNLGENQLFGQMDWSKFEIRNPKTLYSIEGEEYQGNEELSNDCDLDSVTCKTKENIERFSLFVKQLRTKINDSEREQEVRDFILEYINVPYAIDYILETNLLGNADSRKKNVQWVTWNGKVWTPCPYDQDVSFVIPTTGLYKGATTGREVKESEELPFYYVKMYFSKEIQERYFELRRLNVFSVENISKIFDDWYVLWDHEGFYDMEFDKWKETPSHRESLINTGYWDIAWGESQKFMGLMTGGAYKSTTKYLPGTFSYEKKSKTVYRCLRACQGIPLTDTTYWENVTWKQNHTYEQGDICFYGDTEYACFKCKKTCKNKAPLLGFYENNPKILGYEDSRERVLLFIKNSIEYFDLLYGYADAREKEVY